MLLGMDPQSLSHPELVALVQQQEALLADLRATVAAQHTTIATLEQRLHDLERGSGPPQRMPGHKPGASTARRPGPRRKRALNFSRPRSTPTARVGHAVAHCPRCGTALAGGTVKRTREVIEVVLPPATITAHVYLERCCPECGQRHTPAVDLAGTVLDHSRLGVGLVSLIATLREAARLPIRAIQRYLASVHGVALSVGGIVGALEQVARHGQAAYQQLAANVRSSPVVHADETGWREDGVNGYVWTFATPDTRYFSYGSRAKGMVDQVLGVDGEGVLVSDFYAAYEHYPGLQQKCWAHLLRDIHDLLGQHPEAADLARWATAVRDCYQQAVEQGQRLAREPAETPARMQARRRAMADLQAHCQPYLDDADAPQAVLCRRIAKHLASLFVFLLDPRVPATNNAAERSLRPVVTSRKVSGGTRSATGTQTKLVLASLFGTWQAQGHDPYAACRELLVSPQG